MNVDRCCGRLGAGLSRSFTTRPGVNDAFSGSGRSPFSNVGGTVGECSSVMARQKRALARSPDACRRRRRGPFPAQPAVRRLGHERDGRPLELHPLVDLGFDRVDRQLEPAVLRGARQLLLGALAAAQRHSDELSDEARLHAVPVEPRLVGDDEVVPLRWCEADSPTQRCCRLGGQALRPPPASGESPPALLPTFRRTAHWPAPCRSARRWRRSRGRTGRRNRRGHELLARLLCRSAIGRQLRIPLQGDVTWRWRASPPPDPLPAGAPPASTTAVGRACLLRT